MFCKFVEKNISAYMDGETGRAASYLISRHLASCASCRSKLALLTAISKAAKQKEDIKLSADFMQALKMKVLEVKIKQGTVPVVTKKSFALKLGLSALGFVLAFISMVLVVPRQHGKDINEFATVAFQTKAEVIATGSGLEYATFTNQTRR